MQSRRGKPARHATPMPEEPRTEPSIQPVLNSDPPIVGSGAKANHEDQDVWVEGHKIQIYDLSDGMCAIRTSSEDIKTNKVIDFKLQRGKHTAQGEAASSSNGVVEREHGIHDEAKVLKSTLSEVKVPENKVKSDAPEKKAPEPKVSENKTTVTSEHDSKDLLSAVMAQVKHIGTGPVPHAVNDTIVAYIFVNGLKIKLSLEVVDTVNTNANVQEKTKLTKLDKATVPKETVKVLPKETKDIIPKERMDLRLKEKKVITHMATLDPSPKKPTNIVPSKDLVPFSARSTGMEEDIYANESLSSEEPHISEPLSLIIFTGDEQKPPKRPQQGTPNSPRTALRIAPPLGTKPYARKPCTFVNTLRGCNNGATCVFSHDLQGVVCGKGRARATCPNGWRCFYLHGADDRAHTPQERPAGAAPKTAMNAELQRRLAGLNAVRQAEKDALRDGDAAAAGEQQRELPWPVTPGQMGPPAGPKALGEGQVAGKKRGLEESHEAPRGKRARKEGPGS